jgi:hypothetical protein
MLPLGMFVAAVAAVLSSINLPGDKRAIREENAP